VHEKLKREEAGLLSRSPAVSGLKHRVVESDEVEFSQLTMTFVHFI
jgi:hypothetical protein